MREQVAEERSHGLAHLCVRSRKKRSVRGEREAREGTDIVNNRNAYSENEQETTVEKNSTREETRGTRHQSVRASMRSGKRQERCERRSGHCFIVLAEPRVRHLNNASYCSCSLSTTVNVGKTVCSLSTNLAIFANGCMRLRGNSEKNVAKVCRINSTNCLPNFGGLILGCI